MTFAAKGSPPGHGGDPLELSSYGGVDLQANISNEAPAQDKFRNPRAVREAKRELLREAVHEACGFIRLHAETCQLNVEAGDDTGAVYSLGRLIALPNSRRNRATIFVRSGTKTPPTRKAGQ
jgi:hypothetical protein